MPKKCVGILGILGNLGSLETQQQSSQSSPVEFCRDKTALSPEEQHLSTVPVRSKNSVAKNAILSIRDAQVGNEPPHAAVASDPGRITTVR